MDSAADWVDKLCMLSTDSSESLLTCTRCQSNRVRHALLGGDVVSVTCSYERMGSFKKQCMIVQWGTRDAVRRRGDVGVARPVCVDVSGQSSSCDVCQCQLGLLYIVTWACWVCTDQVLLRGEGFLTAKGGLMCAWLPRCVHS